MIGNTVLILVTLSISGCGEPETEVSVKVLLEGFEGELKKSQLPQDAVLSDSIIETIATKYQKAFDENDIDQIKARLKRELSCSSGKEEPWLFRLEVSMENKAFGVAILNGWVEVLDDQANKGLNTRTKTVKEISNAVKRLEKELAQVEKQMIGLEKERREKTKLGSGLKRDKIPDSYSATKKKYEEVSESIRSKKIQLAEIELSTLAVKKKRVNILTRIDSVEVTEADVRDYQKRKKDCPGLPDVKFSIAR